jgi:ATP-dependent RNA helicase DeaD
MIIVLTTHNKEGLCYMNMNTKIKTFNELSISPSLIKALDKLKIVSMFPVQQEAIPLALQGKDIIGQAQTGTGKTIAFSIPLIEKITEKKKVQALVLCPTRELALQVREEIYKLTKYKSHIISLAIYGGEPIQRQIRQLSRGAHIVVGTPGRVLDHLKRKTLSLKNVSMAVLDEADEMLSMGFREDIEEILSHTPKEKQTLLFSATISCSVTKLAKKFQNNPSIIKINKTDNETQKTIKQLYFDVDFGKRLDVFSHLLKTYNPQQSIVFCNTKRCVGNLTSRLKAKGLLVGELHSDIRQNQRTKIMNLFREKKFSILVATDVAARGIDVANVEAVFNYELPQDSESYIHRIGRTGRAGKEGLAISFVTSREKYKLKNIMRRINANIEKTKVPTQQELEALHVSNIMKKISNIIQKEQHNRYVNLVEQHLLKKNHPLIEVASALLCMNLQK